MCILSLAECELFSYFDNKFKFLQTRIRKTKIMNKQAAVPSEQKLLNVLIKISQIK